MWEQEGPREISGQGHVSWLRKINPEVGGGAPSGGGHYPVKQKSGVPEE